MAENTEPVEYRSVIKFLVFKKTPPAEIMAQLQEVYRENTPSRATVYYWIKEFKSGRNSVFDDNSKGGRPVEICEEKETQCAALVSENSHIRIDELADLLNVSHGTVCKFLSNLGIRKLCSRFVPKFITREMADVRVSACRSNLDLLRQHGETFLNGIITEDETPVSLFLPASKRDSAEWCLPGEQAPKQLRTGAAQKSCAMLSVFWNRDGILLLDFLKRPKTINAEYYSNLLKSLFDSLPKSRTRNRKLFLLHDNAPVHTAFRTQEAISDLGFTVCRHPPYSPDLAPSDFHLFGFLKKKLRGVRFESEMDVETEVRKILNSCDSEFFRTAFDELVKRWQKCIDVNGFYIEK